MLELSLQYWMTQIGSRDMEWNREWISEVYIQAKSAEIEITKQYLSYEVSDLVGDVGGYLGLYLGWSILGITVYLSNIFSKVMSFMKKTWSKTT